MEGGGDGAMTGWARREPRRFAVLLVAVCFPLVWLLSTLIPLGEWLGFEYLVALRHGVSLLLAVLLSRACFGPWHVPLRWRHYFRVLFSYGLLGIAGSVGAFFMGRPTIDRSPGLWEVVPHLAMNLAIAVNEEFIFRGIVLYALLGAMRGADGEIRHRGGWRSIRRAVLFSSALFGLRHLLTLLDHPQQYVTTGFQVLATAMAGVYLCAIVLCRGNIWVAVTVHLLQGLAISIMEPFSSAAQARAVDDIGWLPGVFMLVIQLPYLWLGLRMLRQLAGTRRLNA